MAALAAITSLRTSSFCTAVRLADRALDIAICFGLLGLATLGIAAVCVTLNAPDMVTQATALVGVGTALGRAVTRK